MNSVTICAVTKFPSLASGFCKIRCVCFVLMFKKCIKINSDISVVSSNDVSEDPARKKLAG